MTREPFCSTCQNTGRIAGGARCPVCNPRPTATMLSAQRQLSGIGARFPDRSAVRRALDQQESER